MNIAYISSMLDQIRRNLVPTKQLIFTITSTGTVTIHKQYGWGTPLNNTDIILSNGIVTITSRGSEFASDGLFVSINTNAAYSWVDAGTLRITAKYGLANKMSVKIQGQL